MAYTRQTVANTRALERLIRARAASGVSGALSPTQQESDVDPNEAISFDIDLSGRQVVRTGIHLDDELKRALEDTGARVDEVRYFRGNPDLYETVIVGAVMARGSTSSGKTFELYVTPVIHTGEEGQQVSRIHVESGVDNPSDLAQQRLTSLVAQAFVGINPNYMS